VGGREPVVRVGRLPAVDDTRFLYEQELRFGTFENVWQT
jgi:hypothetical protein